MSLPINDLPGEGGTEGALFPPEFRDLEGQEKRTKRQINNSLLLAPQNQNSNEDSVIFVQITDNYKNNDE